MGKGILKENMSKKELAESLQILEDYLEIEHGVKDFNYIYDVWSKKKSY